MLFFFFFTLEKGDLSSLHLCLHNFPVGENVQLSTCPQADLSLFMLTFSQKYNYMTNTV